MQSLLEYPAARPGTGMYRECAQGSYMTKKVEGLKKLQNKLVNGLR